MATTRAIQYIAKFTGGLIIPSGAGEGRQLVSNSEGKGEWKNKKVRTYHTYMIKGAVKAESLPPFWASLAEGETEIKLVKARYKILEGTKAVIEIKKNGAGATGFTALEVTSTAGQVTPTGIKLEENDELEPVITEVAGEPEFLSFQIILEHTL